MKVLVKNEREKVFRPVTISFTLETKEEMKEVFWQLGKTDGNMMFRVYSAVYNHLQDIGYVDFDGKWID